jgi:superfamily II RNA helicase
LSRGIAVHHAQLPTRLRSKIVDLVKLKVYTITIATSTLTEGVNLPFDNIFLPLVYRWDGKMPEVLKTSEIRNLMGRAGRPGSSGEGIILVCISEESFSREGSKARGQHQKTISYNKSRYSQLIRRVTRKGPSDSNHENSPLKALLDELEKKYNEAFDPEESDDFNKWLAETENPVEFSEENSKVVETIDSVDHFI